MEVYFNMEPEFFGIAESLYSLTQSDVEALARKYQSERVEVRISTERFPDPEIELMYFFGGALLGRLGGFNIDGILKDLEVKRCH